MEKKGTIKKTSTKTTTSSYEVRKESRGKAMKDVVSSADSATKFLKSVGILNRSGNLSKDYKPKR